MADLIEAGKIASTHGVRGAVRIFPMCDSPEWLCGFDKLYIEGEAQQRRVVSASVHKSLVLCELDGVDTLEKAIALKNKLVYINRADVQLETGRHFIRDLIGLRVVDAKQGALGTVADVLTLPAQNVYVVRGEREYMIPAVDEFIKRVDTDGGVIEVEIIEGM